MDATAAIQALTKKVDHLNRMVSDMRKEKLKDERKETWVRVGTIRELTPWTDKRKLEKARREGLLKQRRGANGIEYLLESIPEIFLKQKQAS
jgi:hypothetical protein